MCKGQELQSRLEGNERNARRQRPRAALCCEVSRDEERGLQSSRKNQSCPKAGISVEPDS